MVSVVVVVAVVEEEFLSIASVFDSVFRIMDSKSSPHAHTLSVSQFSHIVSYVNPISRGAFVHTHEVEVRLERLTLVLSDVHSSTVRDCDIVPIFTRGNIQCSLAERKWGPIFVNHMTFDSTHLVIEMRAICERGVLRLFLCRG